MIKVSHAVATWFASGIKFSPPTATIGLMEIIPRILQSSVKNTPPNVPAVNLLGSSGNAWDAARPVRSFT